MKTRLYVIVEWDHNGQPHVSSYSGYAGQVYYYRENAVDDLRRTRREAESFNRKVRFTLAQLILENDEP